MVELTPQAFAERWNKSTLSERSSYQQHFLDLCRMLGQPTPVEVDPTGEFYTFEKGVEKSGGGKGFADVWRKGRFAIEYKGRHKDLNAALSQLQQYQGALGNPPLLMVTDTYRYKVHTTFTDVVTETYEFTNDELPEPENLSVLRAMFTDPDALKPTRTVESVTEEAARKFAQLADGLRARGVEPHEAAHFLNKLLFCLFAEDIRLLPEGLFTRIVERTMREPERFAIYVRDLFRAMRDGGDFLLEDIPRFNGGLYESGDVVPLTNSEIRLLAETARLDWGSIEPTIFGTLFERSLDPSQRARLGAHYTSLEDILAIVEPVLMAPLRREWEGVREKAGAEAEKARTLSGRAATNALRRAESLLLDFAEKLRGVRVLDPACGSGNFLYVSLKELLNLEKEVTTFAGSIGLTPFFPEVSPEQLYGIETNPYAHELAQVAVWIGYLQWRVENGFGTRPEPILGPMTNIIETDALMIRDENGILREPEWPEADVIVGNPPFLGGNKIRAELGGEYVEDLFELYKGRVPAFADLVCYWFEKARKRIASGQAKRAGLLATNSIRGGVNRKVLQRIKESGDIFFAESDRPWILNGAAVRVSMVGFDDGTEVEKVLDGVPADMVYADLTSTADLSTARRLLENFDTCFMGPSPKAPFDIDAQVAERMLNAPTNVNGRPNSDVVRPVASAVDIVRRSRGKWTIDFGMMPFEEASLYELPFEYVREHILPIRSQSRRDDFQGQWWRYARPRPEMRTALEGKARFIATPAVAKHRVFVWMSPEVLCNQGTLVFALEDDYPFGLLHSRVHELWALRMGTSLEDRPRYTPTTCFETFPFPEPDEGQRAEISAAAKRLDALRRNWLNPEGATEAELKKRTLTNLYNARPTWLANAHTRLDAAVFASYGWEEEPGELSDEEMLRRLLALNLEREPV